MKQQFFAILFVAITINVTSSADLTLEELTLENVEAVEPNRPDEPTIESFSLEAATRFLDQASLHWTKSRKCFTCHTNFAYLMARPTVAKDARAHQQIRASLEEMVEKRWEKQGPRWDAEVAMSAAVLAINDAATTEKLHPTTRKALDRMWSIQRPNGGIDWLKCDWPPMESDDEFGAAIMALAAGAAPEHYRKTKEAEVGLERLRKYFETHPAPTLHHEAMMVWADSYLGDLLSAEQRASTTKHLLDLQKADGGWNLATLGNWKRGDGKEHDFASSDGYATGFVIYVLRRAGLEADDARLRKGIEWLKQNQRSTGRWFTRSLFKDNEHFISHAGTAFAVLAIKACETSKGVEDSAAGGSKRNLGDQQLKISRQ